MYRCTYFSTLSVIITLYLKVHLSTFRRRTKELVSPVILLEHGDLTSNGTWKRNEGFQTSTKIADNEAALSPQPRLVKI